MASSHLPTEAPSLCTEGEKAQIQAAATELLSCPIDPRLRPKVQSISVWSGSVSKKQADLISDLYVKILGRRLI